MISKRLIKLFSWILFLFFLTIVSFYIALKSGFNIDSLEFKGYKVENLHIKLNDKFIIKASSLSKNSKNISKKDKLKDTNQTDKKAKSLFSNISLARIYLNKLIKASELFEYISLKEINLSNRKLLFNFSDNGLFHIDDKAFEFKGKVLKLPDYFKITYPLIYLKKYDLKLKGDLLYFPDSLDINLTGNYILKDINGSYRANLKDKVIDFEINSTTTSSLKSVLDLFRMNFITREWLYNRIKAKKYKLIFLRGRVKVVDNRVVPLFDTFKAEVELNDLNVTFHSKLPPITAKSAIITLKNRNLYFDFKEPKYQNRLISGSKVTLLHIFNKKRLTLKLYIVYKGVMDRKVIHILNTYKVPIAITQRGGESFGVLEMDIPLQRGKRATYHSKVTLKGGELIFKKSIYKIKRGDVEVDGKIIKLKNMHLKWQNLTGVVDGELNLAKQRGDFNLFIKSFYLPLGMGFIKIKNKKLPIVVTWAKGYKLINIPSMKTKIKIKREGFEIDTKKLSLWKSYLGGFLTLFSGGVVKIATKDLKSYSISGDLYWRSCPLCKKGKDDRDKKGSSVKKWSFDAKVTKESLLLSTKAKALIYNSKKRLLVINNLNIDNQLLQKMLKRLEKSAKESKKEDSKVSKSKKDSRSGLKNLKVIGKNSTIFFPDYKISCQKFILKVKGDLKYFTCYQKSYKLNATIDSLGVKRLTSNEIDDIALNAIFDFRPIQNTRYKIDISRLKKDIFSGKVLIKGGVIKEIKEFDKDGFKLKRGDLKFKLIKDNLKLNSILLEGESATIAGDGEVNIKTKALNLNLAVQTAREIGKAIGSIPIVGYILFGKDKSFTVGVKVKGTIDKPDIKSSPVGEAFTYPLQILKRAIEAPSKIK